MKQCVDSENLHRRLKKIIGQVQAIDRMVDEGRALRGRAVPDQRGEIRTERLRKGRSGRT